MKRVLLLFVLLITISYYCLSYQKKNLTLSFEGVMLVGEMPLPGVTVQLAKDDLPLGVPYSSVSKANGHFTLQVNARENQPIKLEFQKEGYQIKDTTVFTVQEKLHLNLSSIVLLPKSSATPPITLKTANPSPASAGAEK